MSPDTSAERIGTVVNIGQVIGPVGVGTRGAEAPHEIPEPELRLPSHKIEGREPLVAEVLAGIDAGQRDFGFEFLAGVGKTTLAAELIRSEELRSRFDGVLWAHLGQTPDVRSELLKWAEAVGLDETAVAKRKTEGELGRAIAAKFGKRRLLLIIDDVWTAEHGQLFMLDGPQVRRVLTSRKRGVARELSPNARVLVVPKLSQHDSVKLLRALGQQVGDAEAGKLATLAERVDGLPLALVLLGKMLRNKAEDEAPVQSLLDSLSNIGEVFEQKKPIEFTENMSRTMAEVIEAGYEQLGTSGLLDSEQLDGDMLRDAVAALAVLRPDPLCFDEALARTVTGVSALALRQLAQAGMLERRQSRTGEEPQYTMHRVIAEFLRSKLKETRLKQLNTRAAQYFLEQLKTIEEQEYQKRTQYLALYRYENPAWREAQDNWLYHFAQAGYNPAATLAFLRVWLTAFWWWSCFTDKGFDFCDQLLDEWEHRLALSGPEGGTATAAPLQSQSGERVNRMREGLVLLRRFKLNYPKETEADRSSGERWSEVQAVMTEMRRRTGLDGEAPGAASPDACVVRAFSSIFLAEAARFGARDYEAAQLLYLDAQALFLTVGDDWDGAWVCYHLADMLAGCGQLEQARPLCEQALWLGTGQADPEVIALAQRVLGDIALTTGAFDEAGRRYKAAIESAYRFQIEPELPDEYTIGFYPELAGDVAQRLLQLHAGQPEHARALAQTLREPWLRVAALASAGEPSSVDPFDADARSLAAWLFPPPLDSDQLTDQGRDYGERVAGHLARLRLKAKST